MYTPDHRRRRPRRSTRRTFRGYAAASRYVDDEAADDGTSRTRRRGAPVYNTDNESLDGFICGDDEVEMETGAEEEEEDEKGHARARRARRRARRRTRTQPRRHARSTPSRSRRSSPATHHVVTLTSDDDSSDEGSGEEETKAGTRDSTGEPSGAGGRLRSIDMKLAAMQRRLDAMQAKQDIDRPFDRRDVATMRRMVKWWKTNPPSHRSLARYVRQDPPRSHSDDDDDDDDDDDGHDGGHDGGGTQGALHDKDGARTFTKFLIGDLTNETMLRKLWASMAAHRIDPSSMKTDGLVSIRGSPPYKTTLVKNIVGPCMMQAELRRVSAEMKHRHMTVAQEAPTAECTASSNVTYHMFVGEPGTGKTSAAVACAKQLMNELGTERVQMMQLNKAALPGTWENKSNEKLQTMLLACLYPPTGVDLTFLLVDEGEVLFGRADLATTYDRQLLHTFVTTLETTITSRARPTPAHVCVVFTSNDGSHFDSKILSRAGGSYVVFEPLQPKVMNAILHHTWDRRVKDVAGGLGLAPTLAVAEGRHQAELRMLDTECAEECIACVGKGDVRVLHAAVGMAFEHALHHAAARCVQAGKNGGENKENEENEDEDDEDVGTQRMLSSVRQYIEAKTRGWRIMHRLQTAQDGMSVAEDICKDPVRLRQLLDAWRFVPTCEDMRTAFHEVAKRQAQTAHTVRAFECVGVGHADARSDAVKRRRQEEEEGEEEGEGMHDGAATPPSPKRRRRYARPKQTTKTKC